jgi:hypothetical protein
MKKMFFAIAASFLLVLVTGFTVHQPAAIKKLLKKSKARDNGPVWINCNRGYVNSCDEITHYYVVDGEPGDTYSWVWDPAQPGLPNVYLGTNNYADVQLSVGDRLIVRVNSLYYGEYDYWDTAAPCE